MGISTQHFQNVRDFNSNPINDFKNTRDFNSNPKPSKIPDYAKDYKNEYLFLFGIDKEFSYFHKEIYYNDAKLGSFAKRIKCIDRLNRIINYYKKCLDSGVLKDLSEEELGIEVF